MAGYVGGVGWLGEKSKQGIEREPYGRDLEFGSGPEFSE